MAGSSACGSGRGSPDLRLTRAQALQDAWRAAGKKLDMGKACLRFRPWEDLVPEAIAANIAAVPLEAYVDFAKGVRAQAKARRKRAAKAPRRYHAGEGAGRCAAGS